MIGFSAFKTRKPRQFEYKPLYYDPEKEKREERRKELLGADAAEKHEGEYKPGQYIRGNMRTRRGIGERKATKRSRPMIMIAVLILLGYAVWWVLN